MKVHQSATVVHRANTTAGQAWQNAFFVPKASFSLVADKSCVRCVQQEHSQTRQPRQSVRSVLLANSSKTMGAWPVMNVLWGSHSQKRVQLNAILVKLAHIAALTMSQQNAISVLSANFRVPQRQRSVLHAKSVSTKIQQVQAHAMHAPAQGMAQTA